LCALKVRLVLEVANFIKNRPITREWIRMPSRSAVTKLQVILIIDLLVVAFAAGGYYYVQSLPPPLKKAEFQVTNLTIDPLEAGTDQPITISVNVTNVGEETGNHSVTLTINDAVKETKTAQLLGNESKIVEFQVTESSEGSYFVKIEGLNGTFTISAAPPPSTFKLSDLLISPYEAWVGNPIKISVKVSNTGDKHYSYSLAFKVNDVVRETKTIQLSAGETTTVEANVTESSEGTYSVNVGGLTGKFYIVPTGKHTLKVVTAYSGLLFTLDGNPNTTPYSALLDVGTHTLAAPDSFTTHKGGVLKFLQWPDGDTNPVKTINLQSWTLLVPTYKIISGIASCPSLYVWNGNNYVYRTEVSSGTGYLGILDHFRADGSIAFDYSYPWDYLKLDRNQIQPRNGYYDMILTQESDELFYLDAAKLIVVDHSPNLDVYSTKGTYMYNLTGQGKIYTVGKNPLTPISAVNGKGEDALPQIAKLDGIYSPGHPDLQWDSLELNLGNLTGAKEIKLIVAGLIIYSSGQVQGEWAQKFVTQPGVQPFPPPYMEVKDKNGNWTRVPDDTEFPLTEVNPESFVVNLTGLFPTNDYSLKIHTFFDTRFDYIGIDTTPQQNVAIKEIDSVHSDFSQVFGTLSTSTGNFTRYGDVTALMLYADDKFVIGRQGDQIHLMFPADIGPVPEGMERDFFVFVSCWFKVKGLPYLAFTVDPIPFHDMSCFPYPPTERYPCDGDHLSYLLEYNTRTIAIP
jgi:hypothetical protein